MLPAEKRAKEKRYALKIGGGIPLILTLIGDYGPSINKDFPGWLNIVSGALTIPAFLIFVYILESKLPIVAFFKASGKYLFQASGAVLALVLADKLQTGPDVRLYSDYLLAVYAATVIAVRVRFRMSLWSLQYELLFYRFVYWFIAVLVAIFSPLILPFIPFLNLPGLLSKLAIAILIIFLLSFIGLFLRLADVFTGIEESRVKSYWKAYATPEYEAILMGEEFDHHPEVALSRWQQFKTRFRGFIRRR